MIDSKILSSKKFKTLKNVILTFKGRELLVYPYPIFITPWIEETAVKEASMLPEIVHYYRDVPLSIYFNSSSYRPMFLKTKFPKVSEDFVGYEEYKGGEDYYVRGYTDYLIEFITAWSISASSEFIYKLYSEMFDQSQQIMKNMNQDKEDFFEGVKDIIIDISQPPYLEEFKAAKKQLQEDPDLAIDSSQFKSEEALQDYNKKKEEILRIFREFASRDIQPFYTFQRYKCGLEECKSILITYLSETADYGYAGVDENFFKKYDHRLQLAFILDYHRYFLFWFSPSLYTERFERLNAINFFDREFGPGKAVLPIHYARKSYLRVFYRKISLFF